MYVSQFSKKPIVLSHMWWTEVWLIVHVDLHKERRIIGATATAKAPFFVSWMEYNIKKSLLPCTRSSSVYLYQDLLIQ
jgi:hypothetical protein